MDVMLSDIARSEALSTAFYDTSKEERLLDVTVLTRGMWPHFQQIDVRVPIEFSEGASPCKFPAVLACIDAAVIAAASEYELLYTTPPIYAPPAELARSRHKLAWAFDLGTAEVEMHTNTADIRLRTTVLQALCVLRTCRAIAALSLTSAAVNAAFSCCSIATVRSRTVPTSGRVRESCG
jgi:hypothetical protein